MVFPSKNNYSSLAKIGFTYTFLLEAITNDHELMQKYLVKAFNNHNKSTDLTSFGDNDLILNIANNLNTAGKFTHNGFVFHNEFIHEPIYWYVNFPLNNKLRIISLSCEQKPPSSNVISLIRNNIYLSFKKHSVKKKGRKQKQRN